MLYSMWPLAAGMAMMMGCLAYGYFSYPHWEGIGPTFRAGLLQGNLSLDEPGDVLSDKFMNGYIQMADQLEAQDVDLLVLPESPAPLSFQYDSKYGQAMIHLAQRYPLGLVFNNIAYANVEGEVCYYNSAYFLGADGKETGRYDKIHLVPFGEYIPWRSLFSFAETISRDVGSFSAGKNYLVVNLIKHPASAVICYEIIFPDLVRRFVLKGSSLIINLTNDQWYGNTAAPYQHFAMSRWRAIENRRYLLRAANSGISAIVGPTGRIQAATDILRRDVCVGEFAFVSEMTVYARYGDLLVYLCAIIIMVVLISAKYARPEGNKAIGKNI
jgi:apolipoprotein N-acyltransferase